MGNMQCRRGGDKHAGAKNDLRALVSALRRVVRKRLGRRASFAKHEAVALEVLNQAGAQHLQDELQILADRQPKNFIFNGMRYRPHSPGRWLTTACAAPLKCGDSPTGAVGCATATPSCHLKSLGRWLSDSHRHLLAVWLPAMPRQTCAAIMRILSLRIEHLHRERRWNAPQNALDKGCATRWRKSNPSFGATKCCQWEPTLLPLASTGRRSPWRKIARQERRPTLIGGDGRNHTCDRLPAPLMSIFAWHTWPHSPSRIVMVKGFCRNGTQFQAMKGRRQSSRG